MIYLLKYCASFLAWFLFKKAFIVFEFYRRNSSYYIGKILLYEPLLHSNNSHYNYFLYSHAMVYIGFSNKELYSYT